MLKIDNTLLEEIGLGGLPEVEKNSFLKHVYETLEMRVGIRLADQMTNEQLDEFEQYFEAKDDAGAFKWLETNFPNYKDIVQEEFDKLKAEVAQTAPQILAASQAAHAQSQSQPQYPPSPAPAPAFAPAAAPVSSFDPPQQSASEPAYTPGPPSPPPPPSQPADQFPPPARPAPQQPYQSPAPAPPPAQPLYPPQQPPPGPPQQAS